jgi:hypothetical protein
MKTFRITREAGRMNGAAWILDGPVLEEASVPLVVEDLPRLEADVLLLNVGGSL